MLSNQSFRMPAKTTITSVSTRHTQKSLDCSEWFPKPSKCLNYHHYSAVTFITHLPKFYTLNLSIDMCVYQDVGKKPNIEAKEIIKPQKKKKDFLIVTQLLRRKDWFPCFYVSYPRHNSMKPSQKINKQKLQWYLSYHSSVFHIILGLHHLQKLQIPKIWSKYCTFHKAEWYHL